MYIGQGQSLEARRVAQAEWWALSMAALNAAPAPQLAASLPHAAACSDDMEMRMGMIPLLPMLVQIDADTTSIFEVITEHHHAPLVLSPVLSEGSRSLVFALVLRETPKSIVHPVDMKIRVMLKALAIAVTSVASLATVAAVPSRH
jgi:hypothetical protein